MKSFRDVNPYVIGITTVLFIGAMVGAALAIGIFHVFERAYTVTAVFEDASGVRSGDDVRVAGVKAGRVVAVQADRRHGNVKVEFKVNNSVDLGKNTRAEIALQTLLGRKFIRLTGPVTRPYLADASEADRVIPINRTKVPFDVFELTKIGTRSIEQTNTEQLNALVTSLADITEGKREQVSQLVRGIAQVSEALTSRDAQLRQLLDRGDQLSATLAQKDETLVALIDQSQGVLDLVARRRVDISRGVQSANVAVGQLAGVVTSHKTELDLILETLHPTLDILDRRQADLDRSLGWLGPAALGLSSAATHGPWADVYVRAIGPDLVGLLNSLTAGGGGP